MELTAPRCQGTGITGCRASSDNSPRCAASCCTHHAQSRFPKENGGSLRPQLEQLAMGINGVSQSSQKGVSSFGFQVSSSIAQLET
jgi:hypothetical protein